MGSCGETGPYDDLHTLLALEGALTGKHWRGYRTHRIGIHPIAKSSSVPTEHRLMLLATDVDRTPPPKTRARFLPNALRPDPFDSSCDSDTHGMSELANSSPTTRSHPELAWLKQGGELGELISNFTWDTT